MAAIAFPNKVVQPGESFGAKAGAAITALNACVVEGASHGLVIQSAGTDAVALGFIQLEGTAAALGDMVDVFRTGIVWATASAAITINTYVMTAAAGRVATATTGLVYVGIARGTASNAGDIIPVEIAFGETA